MLAAADDCVYLVEPEHQCGGCDYKGSTCCTPGYECMEMGVDYYEVNMRDGLKRESQKFLVVPCFQEFVREVVPSEATNLKYTLDCAVCFSPPFCAEATDEIIRRVSPKILIPQVVNSSISHFCFTFSSTINNPLPLPRLPLAFHYYLQCCLEGIDFKKMNQPPPPSRTQGGD